MKRIAIDMDEVMADFNLKIIDLVNREYQGNVTLDEFNGKKLTQIRPHLNDQVREHIIASNFFRDLPVMKDSQQVIEELSRTYEIFITTAAMEFPSSFTAKYEWLKEHFGFLKDMNFVFCGDKSIIHADYLIDDNSRHFTRFQGQGLLFTSPHNIYETGCVRVNNWLEVRDYFLG